MRWYLAYSGLGSRVRGPGEASRARTTPGRGCLGCRGAGVQGLVSCVGVVCWCVEGSNGAHNTNQTHNRHFLQGSRITDKGSGVRGQRQGSRGQGLRGQGSGSTYAQQAS